MDRDALTGMDLVNLDAIRATLAGRAALTRQFAYGAATDARPYVLSHLTGAYSSIPELLDPKHDVRTDEDAEAYLARLRMFGRSEERRVGKECVGTVRARGLASHYIKK